MRRREFLVLCGEWPMHREFTWFLGSGASLQPWGAGAQQSTPTIGLLSTRSPADSAHLLAALRRGLAETAHIEGQTLSIEYRWAAGDYGRLLPLAEDLIHRRVAVPLAIGGPPAALAAKAATSTTPIVFLMGGNPTTLGLVASYNHPGGNATGISMSVHASLESKRLELLHEMVPRASRLGFLVNPTFPPADFQVEDAQRGGRAIGVAVEVLRASTDSELDAAFRRAAKSQIAGLAIASDPFFQSRADKLVALAARHAIPTIYEVREYVEAGGLASYGIDNREVWRQVGVYTSRILSGETPANLPVVSPNKIEFVINLKTAKALGLQIPTMLHGQVDEVIE